jgi:SAM-dependent methyltransferase
MLRRAIADLPDPSRPLLLDVGSGRAGVAAFLPDVDVTGVDLRPPSEPLPNLTFEWGTITDLPFPDRSFQLVTCIDVLENLSVESREKAVSELVRVARHAVLIACPHGHIAQSCDRKYERALEARGRPIPEWITEHRAHPYPTDSSVAESVRMANRDARISLSYCEPASICRLVRAAAARSTTLYAAVNLLFGLLLPLMPQPSAATGYRMVLFAEVG